MDERVRQLGTRQHGVVSRPQLLRLGITRSHLDGLVRRGALSVLHRSVYHIRDGEATLWTTATAALLAAHGAGGAVDLSTRAAKRCAVSHLLAAALWEYLPFLPGSRVDVAGTRLCRLPTLHVHRTRLCDDEVTCLRGVTLTSPARTILDLAGVVSPRQLEQALAAAERRSPAVRGRLRDLLQRRPRHAGSGILRRLLDGLDSTGTNPLFLRSRAEEEALALFRRARLPEPTCNVSIAGLQVDFAWPSLRLVVEIDGFAFHGSGEAFHRDRDRDRTLTLAGYQILRFTWRQLTHDVAATLAAVALTIGSRQALLAREGVKVAQIASSRRRRPVGDAK